MKNFLKLASALALSCTFLAAHAQQGDGKMMKKDEKSEGKMMMKKEGKMGSNYKMAKKGDKMVKKDAKMMSKDKM